MMLEAQEKSAINDQISSLRTQIEHAESELRHLRIQLQQAESNASARRHIQQTTTEVVNNFKGPTASESHQTNVITQSGQIDQKAASSRWPLASEEYKRYGRQLILPEIGLQGQVRLRKARVLIVGVGGLGCPAAAYLAGAGVGTLGLMDGDTVELSNLHRQIAHSTQRVGMSKVDSAVEYLSSLNSLINYRRHQQHLTPNTAISIFEEYDLILDCTDHPTSRYLISDACVLAGRPLVSASALKTEGQLIIQNNPPKRPGDKSGGPCYRCIFPKPPPAETVVSCGEGGILGPVVGIMGVLQALEAIKLLTAERTEESQPKPTLLMFSAHGEPQFRSIRMRTRRVDCAACSALPSVTRQSLENGSLDYVAFCGITTPLTLLPPESQISVEDFALLQRNDADVVVDTRDRIQYAICAFEGAINVPWMGDARSWAEKAADNRQISSAKHCFVICRLGNDSQLAVKALTEQMNLSNVQIRDIKGGYRAWREQVDPSWPDY